MMTPQLAILKNLMLLQMIMQLVGILEHLLQHLKGTGSCLLGQEQ